MCSSDTGYVISTEDRLFDTEILHVHESHREGEKIVALIIREKDHSMSGDKYFAFMFSTKDFARLATSIVERQSDVLRMVDNPKGDDPLSKSRRMTMDLLFALVEQQTTLIVCLID